MLTKENLKEIAAQLKTPNGKNGIEMDKSMNEKNIAMTISAIDMIPIKENQDILELGHGIGGHVKSILDKAANITYTGLEISEEMKIQAMKVNRAYLTDQRAYFSTYNGTELPFNPNTFDHLLSVNTIYFWENPEKLMQQLFHVLKPNGTCCICFADQSFMQTLPFTQYGFTLYTISTFTKLVNETGFSIQKSEQKQDTVISKAGDKVTRKYHVVLLSK